MLKRRRAVVLALVFSCNLVAMDAWETLDIPQNWEMPDFINVPMEGKENNAEKPSVINFEDDSQSLAENFDEDEENLVSLPGKTCSPEIFSAMNPFFLGDQARSASSHPSFQAESDLSYPMPEMPNCTASSNFVSNGAQQCHLNIAMGYAWPLTVPPPIIVTQPVNTAKEENPTIEKCTGSMRKRTHIKDSNDERPRKRRRENDKSDEELRLCRKRWPMMLEALLKSAKAEQGAQFGADEYSIEVYDLPLLHQNINTIIIREKPTTCLDSRIKSFQVWFTIHGRKRGAPRPEKFIMTIKEDRKDKYTELCESLQIKVAK